MSTHNNLFLSGFEKLHQSGKNLFCPCKCLIRFLILIFFLHAAWWTLHKVEPPSNEKRSKSANRIKANIKRPSKRTKPETEPIKPPKKPKKIKKEVPDPDLLDLSSLSELSSADELLSSDEDAQPLKKKKHEPGLVAKPTFTPKQEQKSLSPPPPPITLPISASKQTPPISTSPKLHTSKAPQTPEAPEALVPPPSRPSPEVPKVTLDAQPETSHSVSSVKEAQPSVSLTMDDDLMDMAVVKEEKPIELAKPTNTIPVSGGVFNQHLSAQDEWSLLQRLEHSSKKLSHAACRYKRKLAVRRLKRNLGIKLFDMDTQIIQLLRTPKHALEPISKETIITPASNQQEDQATDDQQHLLDKITFTPYSSSFASRLFGAIRQRQTITREEPWLSSWNGRKLRPFIRRDFQSKPKRMLLMGQIKACQGKPSQGKKVDGVIPGESIDYVYFQKEHLTQVNQLLSRSFWEGIDVSESLLFPEFSIVALYKRHVIGCAFMTPEAYITYFAVDEGWGNASIGQ